MKGSSKLIKEINIGLFITIVGGVITGLILMNLVTVKQALNTVIENFNLILRKKITVNAFIFIILIIFSLYELIYIIIKHIKEIFISEISEDVRMILHEYDDEQNSRKPPFYVFNVSKYDEKIKILDKRDRHSIFQVLEKRTVENFKDVEIFTIATSNNISVFNNNYDAVVKKILLNSNISYINSFLNSVPDKGSRKKIKLSKKWKKNLWEKIISILTILEYDSTNTLVSTLYSNKIEIPFFYKKKTTIALLRVSDSNAYSKNTAMTILNNMSNYDKCISYFGIWTDLDLLVDYEKSLIKLLSNQKNFVLFIYLKLINDFLNRMRKKEKKKWDKFNKKY